MPEETTKTTGAVRQSSSSLWLVAGVPALLIIGYLIYSAVMQTKSSTEGSRAENSMQSKQGLSSEGK